MPRIVAAIATIAEHIRAMVDDPERYRPENCPKCGLAGLWVHGTYKREAGRGPDHDDPIEVPRFICGKRAAAGRVAPGSRAACPRGAGICGAHSSRCWSGCWQVSR